MQFSILPAVDVKKRVAAKTLLVFFFIIILLTFFSNTINNFSLPKVLVSNTQKGNLLKMVTGDGEIEAVEKADIYYDGDINVKIEEIKVKPGDTVSKGDELIVFRKADIDKAAVQDKLLMGKLKLLYDQARKAYASGSDLLPYKRAVASAKEQWDESRYKWDKVRELFDAGTESQESLRAAEKSAESAEREYKNKAEDYNIASSGKLVELQKLEYDLKMQEEKVRCLTESMKFGNTVCSPYDGIIRNVDITGGMWVNSSVKLCTVENSEKGYEFVADFDTDSTEFIKIEDKARIRIKSLGTDAINGEVKEIKESVKNRGRMKQAVISISNDKIKGGEKGDAFIEKTTKSYENIIPNTAVLPGKSQKDGFVRLLKEKEGFLGNEYYVEIVNVVLIDSDNGYTAISGVISRDDRVIVKCDKPLYDNSRVILDNQPDYLE